jgi:hypothetical protein
MRVLLEMKQQIYWQEQDLNILSQDLNQPVVLTRSCQESGQGLDEHESHKTMGIHNWTRTGKGTYIRTLCRRRKDLLKLNIDKLRWTVGLSQDTVI